MTMAREPMCFCSTMTVDTPLVLKYENASAGCSSRPSALLVSLGDNGIFALNQYLFGSITTISLPAVVASVVLAAVVLTAILGLFDFRGLLYMWRVSRIDFYAATTAIMGVLLLGILQGILLAALISILLLLARASRPHVALLGRVPGTNSYSDLARHPENEPLGSVIACRPEASLLYVNAGSVLETVMASVLKNRSKIRAVVCDLSASPYLDLAGARILHALHDELAAQGIALQIVGARGRVRDLLRADGLAEKVGGLERAVSLDDAISAARRRVAET